MRKQNTMPTDTDVAKLKAGDAAAFRTFFETLYPKFSAYACRFVDQQEAQDLVQNLFISYWEKKEKIACEKTVRYLYRSLYNSCLNHLKHRRVVETYETEMRLAEHQLTYYMEDHSKEHDAFSPVASADMHEAIAALMQNLSPRCSEAFRMRYFEDMPHKDIALRMNISPRTVEGHIRNAILFLRIQFHDFYHTLFLCFIAHL